jgi:hypothetical protein
MIILLALLGETATIAGSTALLLNAGKDILIDLAKKGYKVDDKAVEEYKQKHKEDEEPSKGKKILSRLAFFTPGVNMAVTGIQVHKLKKQIMNDPDFQKIITPMTEDEKEQFAKLKKSTEKLAYLVAISQVNNEEEKVFAVSGNKVLIADSGLVSLSRKDRITSYSYTLDEVKQLNAATGKSYRIGITNDIPIAIIGIPNPEYEVKRVAFDDEEKQDFVNIPKEAAGDRRFFVYGDVIPHPEKLIELANELREKRYAHVPMLQTEQTATKTVEEAPKLVLKNDEQKN